MKKIFAFIALIFTWISCLHASQEHPIIYLVSTPRSLTTAFTRMMHARGDFSIYNEPAHYAYCMQHYPEFAKQNYIKEAPPTYQDVKCELLKSAKEKPVFVKEMSIASEEFLHSNPDFVTLEPARFFFLMRNPHHTVISFYRKCPDPVDELHDVLGYEHLYNIMLWIQERTGKSPYVIVAEDLCNHPEETVAEFCEKMEIAFIPNSTQWEALDEHFNPAVEWHEYKYEGPTLLWHGDAIHSNGFGKPSQYAVDCNGSPTFEEISNLKDREKARAAYLKALPFYEKILKIRDSNG
jgi:hypothetical protein